MFNHKVTLFPHTHLQLIYLGKIGQCASHHAYRPTPRLHIQVALRKQVRFLSYYYSGRIVFVHPCVYEVFQLCKTMYWIYSEIPFGCVITEVGLCVVFGEPFLHRRSVTSAWSRRTVKKPYSNSPLWGLRIIWAQWALNIFLSGNKFLSCGFWFIYFVSLGKMIDGLEIAASFKFMIYLFALFSFLCVFSCLHSVFLGKMGLFWASKCF